MPRPSYWSYIRVEELLALQGGLEGDEAKLSDDEVRFITIHQVDELWFKLVLREMQSARDLFRRDPVPETALSATAQSLKRVTMIFGLATAHFELMETMRPREYLKFRDKLSPASGFQSAQMREIEILLGLDEGQRVRYGNESSFRDALRGEPGEPSPALRRVERRLLDQPSLKDAVYSWLHRTPIHGSTPAAADDDKAVAAFLDQFLGGHTQAMRAAIATHAKEQALTAADEKRLVQQHERQLQGARMFLFAEDVADPDARRQRCRVRAAALFIESHRDLPLLAWPCEILDTIVEMEQAMIVFRQRHARMVERIIGKRIGTGGSDGVDYLDQTARYRVFGDLWAARTLLLHPDLLPAPWHPEHYDFAH